MRREEEDEKGIFGLLEEEEEEQVIWGVLEIEVEFKGEEEE